MAYDCIDKGCQNFDTNTKEILLNTSFIIYPNPSNGNIILTTNESVTISIFNIMGQEILKKNCSGNTAIDLPNFENGIYIVKIFDTNNQLTDTKKLSLNK